MNFKDFLKECYDREVIKSLTIFIITSWTIIQVSSVTHEAIGLPESFVSTLIIIFFLVFPFYLFYVWNRKGKSKNYNSLSEEEQIKNKAFKKRYFQGVTLATLLCLGLISFVVSNIFLERKANAKRLKLNNSDKIAVLHFDNNTSAPENDIISQMTSDWISNGIIRENIAQVISPEIINEYTELIDSKTKIPQIKFLQEYLQPAQIISGSFIENDDEFLFQTRILDGKTGEVITSFNLEICSIDTPLNCIDQIRQVVLTYLTGNDQSKYALEENPPKFSAYEYLIKAKELQNIISEEYLGLLNQAISADENYFEPKVLQVGYYYNLGEYERADSLVKELRKKDITEERQANILKVYENLLKGNNKKATEFMQREYDLAPFDIENNSSYMVFLLQFMNQPKLVPDVFSMVDKKTDALNCEECLNRKKVLFDAKNELKDYDSVIESIENIPGYVNTNTLLFPYTMALVKSQQMEKLGQMMTEAQLSLNKEDLQALTYFALNQSRSTNGLTDSLFNRYKERLTNNQLGYLTFHHGDLKTAKKLLSTSIDSTNLLQTVYRLAIDYKTGNKRGPEKRMQEILSATPKYDYGNTSYQVARFYSLIGDNEKALSHLKDAIQAGAFFTQTTFQNDPDFMQLYDTKEFKDLLTYWW